MDNYIHVLEDNNGFYPIGKGICSPVDLIPMDEDPSNMRMLMLIRIQIYEDAEHMHEIFNRLEKFNIYTTDPNDRHYFSGCELSDLYSRESLSVYLTYKQYEYLSDEEFKNKMSYFSSIIRDDKIDGILNI
jgi:hypothetical protein